MIKKPYAGPQEMRGSFSLDWVDRGHPPRQPPNPDFPDGCDLDASDGFEPTCLMLLPYPCPHKNVGTWMIACNTCGLRVAITSASRADDPRSVKLSCRKGLLH